MRSARKLLTILIIFMLALTLLLPCVTHANEYMQQLTGGEERGGKTLKDVEVWLANLMIDIIRGMENISPIFFILMFFIGVVALVIGGLFGIRGVRAAGGTGILCAIAGYWLINNVHTIVEIIENAAFQ